MKERLQRGLVTRFWDPRRNTRDADSFWMAHPTVRRAINRAITGDPDVWPLEWLNTRFVVAPLRHILVPGCGTGELERDLLAKGLCHRVTAFDLAPRQVEEAARRATDAGLADRIDYSVSAFDELDLEALDLDGCFFHQALHHFPRPDDAVARVARALPSGSLVYFDEYVGPCQANWNATTFRAAREAYTRLPASARQHARLRIPGLLARWSDPSEAVRSEDILPAITRHLEVHVRRDYGGFILMPVWQQATLDDALVGAMVAAEAAQRDRHPTWFSVVVARVP